jgi:hypothetical protein
MLDPELERMHAELEGLQHSIHHVSATMKIEEPHREPKGSQKSRRRRRRRRRQRQGWGQRP